MNNFFTLLVGSALFGAIMWANGVRWGRDAHFKTFKRELILLAIDALQDRIVTARQRHIAVDVSGRNCRPDVAVIRELMDLRSNLERNL